MFTTILAFIIILSVLVFAHELGHFIAAKLSGVRVEEFGIGMLLRLFSIKKGETVYSINALPIGGFVKLTGEDGGDKDDPKSFSSKSKLIRFGILASGVFMNFLLAVLLMTVTFVVGMPEWGGKVIIAEINTGSPAENASLQIEDIIVEANDITIDSTEKLQQITQDNLGKNLKLEIERQGEILVKEVLARSEHPSDQGPLGIKMRVDPVITSVTRYSIIRAPIEGLKLSLKMSEEMVVGIGLIIKNLLISQEVPVGVAGPVGIGQIVGELLKFGITPLIQFAGILSLNLALLNILPFPALDGGRLLFVGIEAITRKRLPYKIEGFIHLVGLIALLGLILLVTYQDILRIVR